MTQRYSTATKKMDVLADTRRDVGRDDVVNVAQQRQLENAVVFGRSR